MYVLRFFFDFGGVCLWAANDAARQLFGYPVEPADLAIPDDLCIALRAACEQFETSLDWDNPAGPSPWSSAQFEAFEEQADELLTRLRAALGPSFEIRDERRTGFGAAADARDQKPLDPR